MARYVQEYQLLEPQEQTWPVVQRYFESQGYVYKNYQNEQVFQKGSGWLMDPAFAKVTYSQNSVRVEIWMKDALVPGVYIREIGIDGFYGWAVKGSMKDAALMLDRLFGGPDARIGCDPWLRKNGPNVSQDGYRQISGVCPHCGAMLPQGSGFCQACGKSAD